MIDLREREISAAPLPQLVGADSQSKVQSNVLVVRDAGALSALCMIFSGLTAFLAGMLLYADPTAKAKLLIRVAVLVLCIIILVLTSAQCYGLHGRKRWAWKAQVWCSALGLLLFPIGTVANWWILAKWFASDVKEWFGVEAK